MRPVGTLGVVAQDLKFYSRRGKGTRTEPEGLAQGYQKGYRSAASPVTVPYWWQASSKTDM